MKGNRIPWMIALVILICLLLFGFGHAARIVQTEGIEGLFDRKRDAVKHVMPEAVPIVDSVEERVLQERKEVQHTGENRATKKNEEGS